MRKVFCDACGLEIKANPATPGLQVSYVSVLVNKFLRNQKQTIGMDYHLGCFASIEVYMLKEEKHGAEGESGSSNSEDE